MKALWLSLALYVLSSSPFAGAVTDDTGAVMQLGKPATRIIALSPHTAELLLEAGGHRQLIAAPGNIDKLPAHTLRIGTLGGIDREQLLQLQPDLVLAWASGNRSSDLAWIERQGIPVYRSEPRNMAAIATALRAIGTLIGQPGRGGLVAQAFERRLRNACRNQPVRETYVAIWDRPALSVGGNHWLSDALKHAKLSNTYAAVSRGVFPVEREALLEKAELLQVVPRAADSKAPNRVYQAQLSRPGPALARAIEQLCHAQGRTEPPTGYSPITPR